ncbi:hypothetical protein MMC25_000432 [Agyrium rufum]|nr:hypothetical protein [Agyrium rufum]
MPPKRAPLASLTAAVNSTPKKIRSKNLKKRAAPTDQPENNNEPAGDPNDIDSEDERLHFLTGNCDQIRAQITNFLNSGAMKVGEFQTAIGVTSHAYHSFMTQHGHLAGQKSSVYLAASLYFKKREIVGLENPKLTMDKTPAAKKAKKSASAGAGAGASGDAKDKDKDKFNVDGIELDGEYRGRVPVYDTCDDVRRKISLHLRNPDVTQAGFLRALSACFGEEQRKLSPSQLQTFRKHKGPIAGNTSAIFYAGFVYFEKLRIKQGKKKSKHREEMEAEWWEQGGVDVESDSSKGFICQAGERPCIDRYGKIRFQ